MGVVRVPSLGIVLQLRMPSRILLPPPDLGLCHSTERNFEPRPSSLKCVSVPCVVW